MSGNILSRQVSVNGSAGAYVEVADKERTRDTLVISNRLTEEPVHIVLGAQSVPADDDDAFLMEIGTALDFTVAPMGPVWARSATTTALTLDVIDG